MDTSEDEGQVSSGSPSPISLNIKASEQSIPWEIPMSSEASSSSSAAVAVRDLGDDNPSASPEVDTTYWAAQEEATALLESMAARVRGEEELSEEQMQANDQLQEDEVIALEAIFGGDMVISENKDSLRFIQIFVHYSLPDGIRVFLNLRRSGTLVGTGDNENHNGGEVCYACRLQHLPPVVLTCLLPRSYPSTCAPYFTISAKWLDEPKVSYLCAAFVRFGQSSQGKKSYTDGGLAE